jgi:predicted negative regulator of RcsB-dependent stress response
MTRTGAAARPPLEDRTESVFQWVRENTRIMLVAVLLVAAVVAAVILYNRSRELKSERAERALFDAQRSLVSGNQQLAQSDLQKMVSRYDGTPAAAQGAMLLAQLLYDQGKYAEGVTVLEKASASRDSKEFGSSLQALIAAGYESQGKFKDAADRYVRAADAALFPLEKQKLQADAARAYGAGGDKTKASALWKSLTTDPDSPVAGEARVRLGELSAQPAGRG